MRVTTLTLTRFRNHAATLLASDAAAIALTGANGAGKTNILEALSLLAPGRGLRQAALPEIAMAGGDGRFAVAATLATGDGGAPVMLGTGTEGAAPGRRRARINGADRALNALGEWVAMLWLTPAMDRLFMEGASGRRRFLDRLTLALFPGHAHAANRYEAAMRARSKLLADPGGHDPLWIDALEAQMGEHGAALDGARRATVRALGAMLAASPVEGFPQPEVVMAATDGSDQAWQAETLTSALRAHRRQDAAAGRALTGPHRQDLSVTMAANGQPAAQCSTGEQKALLLSLILAHADAVEGQRGQRPILLLDEVAAHLDPDRRAALFAILAARSGQCWMTGTEPALFSELGGDRLLLTIADGALR